MDRRFSLRDLALYVFMGVILVSIWLAMFQIDRQWEFIAKVESKLDDQMRDVAELKRELRRGVSLQGPPVETTESWQGFARAESATQMPDYAPGDWLVSYFASDLETLTPFVSSDAYATSVQQWVLDTLATRDPQTLEWLPLVAESWRTSDDGTRITFKVREGVTFSDGEPLTARDVAFTYRFVMDSRIAAPRQRAFISRITDVIATGNEVTFVYEEPYFGAFELAVNMAILPEHFYGRFLESVAAAEEFNISTGYLMGSGPYRLESPTSWTPDQPVELVRNDRYWGWVVPSFDRRVWKVLKSDAGLLTEFKNDDIDVYVARPLEYAGLLKDEKVLENTQRFEYYSARGGYTYVAWNQQRGGEPTIFSDRRVREAMTYLTDRQRIVDEIFLGYAKPANGPYNPLGKQHNPELALRPFDLPRALELLAEAGFEDRDGDGVLESADGQPLRFKLSYPAGSDDYKRLILLLKDLYVRAGIIMEPDPTDWPIMLDKLNKKEFDAISLGWTASFEIDVYQMFHSSQSEPGGDNVMNYSNPELDVLLETARREVDEPKRMQIWRQVHAILWRDQPYTFLTRGKRLEFLNKRLHNVEIVTAGLNSGGLWRMPTEWFVPGVEQRYVQ